MSVFDLPLHFLRPWWWLALAPLPAVLWWLARSRGSWNAFARLADAALLPHLLTGAGARQRAGLVLFGLTWVLAVVALSGPAWQRAPTPTYVNGAARVVALSLSRDMLAQDLRPDRMLHARLAVRELLDTAGDARTALVAYAGAAFTVAPLTDDKRTVLNLLRALQPDVMPVPGNAVAAGIRRSVTLLQQAHVRGGEIVVVTATATPAAAAAASDARARGVRVDVLGVGTTAGAPVPQSGGGFARDAGGLVMARRNDAALRAVATAGGGRYAVLQADGSGVAALGAPATATGHASSGERAHVWLDGGVWLLPALVVLAALAFRRGWLLLLVVLVLPIGAPLAHASTWQALWSNANQRALQALQRGDVAQAGKLATAAGLRGAAEYRAGNYAQAAQAFAAGKDARSRYNLGNALAKQGHYRKAMAAYQGALHADPKMADARANLEAVQAWLQRHAPPPGRARSSQQGAAGSAPNEQSSGTGTGRSADAGQAAGKPARHANSPGAASSPSSKHAANGADGADGAAPEASSNAHPAPGTTAAEAAQAGAPADPAAAQRRQLQQAQRGLARELGAAGHGATRGQRGARAPAFALGQHDAEPADRFNAPQRALLRSVPDDPGALLRRKFQLEWQQRQQQGEGERP